MWAFACELWLIRFWVLVNVCLGVFGLILLMGWGRLIDFCASKKRGFYGLGLGNLGGSFHGNRLMVFLVLSLVKTIKKWKFSLPISKSVCLF